MPRPPLLLLCGLLCDATVWERQTAELASDADVRVRDFRGFDRIEAMAASVLRDAPDQFALAGHSMGARVALEIFRQAPRRVRRIALLDTGIHTVQPGERDRRMRLVALARSRGMHALALEWLPPMLHPQNATAARMAALTSMVERMTPEDFSAQVEALLRRPDPSPALATIDCPALVGVGSDDRWSPPAQHEDIARRIPGARLEVFPGAGHMAPWETPHAVTSAMRAWLAQPARE